MALGFDRPSFLGLFLGFLQGASAVALLASSAWLISRASEKPSVVYISVVVVAIRAFAVGRAGFRYAERLVQHNYAFIFLTKVRVKLFRNMIPLAPVGLTNVSAGAAAKRFIDDVDELQNRNLRVVGPLVQAVSVNLVSAIFLFFLAPMAAVALFVAGTISIISGFFLGIRLVSRAQALNADAKEKLAEIATSYSENQETVLNFGWRPHFEKQLIELDRKIAQSAQSISSQSARSVAIFQLLAVIATILASAFAASAVTAGHIDRVWLAVAALLPMALFDVLSVSQATGAAWHKFAQSRDRVFDILNRETGTSSAPEHLNFQNLQNSNDAERVGFESIEFRQASIGYAQKASPVVEKLNLKISRGETWAFTGPSGTGKSTTALSMLRFLPLLGGELLLNGKPIGDWREAQIRKTVGLVEQIPSIFSGSIKQNLLIAKPDASEEELKAALEAVSLWDAFAERGGLELELEEFGRNISGGEAQRIALARAFLARFPLVILDEPTANLDQENARKLVEDAIQIAHSAQTALVLITHDLDLAKLPAYEVAFGTNSTAIQIR